MSFLGIQAFSHPVNGFCLVWAAGSASADLRGHLSSHIDGVVVTLKKFRLRDCTS
jgi:hypothetical protein